MPTLFNSKEVKKLFGAQSSSETNISELFFTPKYVYKIKKPVDLGFADFSNPEERFRLTKAEYNINKKFSPKIYIDFVPIREYKKRLNLNGKGKILEYAIKMKRLSQKGWLTLLLKNKKASEKLVIKIADMIAKAHSKFPPNKEVLKYGNPKMIKKNWEETLSLLKNDALGIVITNSEFQKLKGLSTLYFEKLIPVFRKRLEENRIQRIHGDLHSENVFVENKTPYLTDAILPIKEWEFGDVAIDVGAMAMDFDAYKQERLSDILVECYARKRKDYSLKNVIHFYKVYSAAIRLWVNSAAIRQNKKGAKEKANRYKKILFNYLSKI